MPLSLSSPPSPLYIPTTQQERLRRGGGSMRALALERSKAEWDAYLRRLNEHR